MSSRLIPPSDGSNALQIATISSTFLVFKHKEIASILANFLNKFAFPSITGMPARGPISPSPKTAVPSVITATILPLDVYLYANSGVSLIAKQAFATPGVYASDKSLRLFISCFRVVSNLPPS